MKYLLPILLMLSLSAQAQNAKSIATDEVKRACTQEAGGKRGGLEANTPEVQKKYKDCIARKGYKL